MKETEFNKTIKSIIIKEGVSTIVNNSFTSMNQLTTITIPSTVTLIGNNCFYGCSSLENILVDSNNTKYESENGILFRKDMKTIVKYPNGKQETNYTIPESVTIINDYAFEGNEILQTIEINQNIQTIGISAFEGMTKIRSLTFYSNINSIGSKSFSNMTLLNTIVYLGTQPPSCGENVFINSE